LCSITTALAATVVIPAAAAIQGDTLRVGVFKLPAATIIATGGEVSAIVAVVTGDDVLQRTQTKQLPHRKVLSSVITFAAQATPILLLVAATVAIAVAK
jgi:hypothetical protein